jgi:hypothetical protein
VKEPESAQRGQYRPRIGHQNLLDSGGRSQYANMKRYLKEVQPVDECHGVEHIAKPPQQNCLDSDILKNIVSGTNILCECLFNTANFYSDFYAYNSLLDVIHL